MNRFVLLSLLTLISIGLHSERLNLNFRHLSLNDGLSQSTVNCIQEDRYGFLWIATANGLNRYDGYKFTVYRYDSQQSASLGNNATRKLYLDPNDLLWIGTGNGLSVYDTSTSTFRNYPLHHNESMGQVNDIMQISNKQYLIASNLGLFIFTEQEGFAPLTCWKNKSATTILRMGNRYFVGGYSGVYEYNVSTSTITPLKGLQEGDVNVLLANTYEPNSLWIGTETHGLILYNSITQHSKKYVHRNGDTRSLSSNSIRSLSYDSSKRLWIGSFVGLNVMNELTGDIQQFFNTGYLENEVSQNSIRSIFRDSQGGMWCGTYFGGLNYYHPLKNQFDGYRYQQSGNKLNDNVVTAIFENSDGALWVGTNDNGLNIIMPDGTVRYYRHDERNGASLSGNNVKCIVPRPGTDEVWIGTHGGGLCIYRKGIFTPVNFTTLTAACSRVYDIAFINDQQVIIGTLAGLIRYDIRTQKSEIIVPSNSPDIYRSCSVMALYTTPDGALWVGTQSGFSRYLINTNSIDESILQLAQKDWHEYVYDFYADHHSNLWIATSLGLFKYNMKNKKLESLDSLELPETSYFKILPDNFSRLWVTSTNGLILIDESTSKWRRYGVEEGLFSNQFNPSSGFKTSRGRLFFGGINGFNSFNPERLMDNPYTPAPIIDNISVYNKQVFPGDETDILPHKCVALTEKVTIPARYAQFGIQFVAPNFVSGKGNNQYAYMLEGFDKEWYYTHKTEVNYSNLQPGKYQFKVKAANSSGKWCSSPTELTIIISPKWYQSWWARLLLVLSLIGAILALFRFRLNQQKMQHELEIERLEKERMRATEQEKIRFFINVSHEFRTPLTLILSPVQEAIRRGVADKWLNKQLQYVQRNAQRMLHLVNQVLDYRRAEMGAMPLQVRSVNVSTFGQTLFDLFTDVALQRRITYTLTDHLPEGELWIDPLYFDRILSNLISNAMKFTPEGGTINVELACDKYELVVQIADTGQGIPAEKQTRVFDRFYQVEENAQGTGVGLSFVKKLIEKHHGSIALRSEVGVGSVFTVLLPCHEGAFTPDEYSQERHDNSQFAYTHTPEVSLLETNKQEDNTPEEELNNDTRATILVVEDDKDIRSYLAENLSDTYHILCASNGEEAWLLITNSTPIDLIVSDVMMPIMDGITLCKKTKQNINHCHIPVLLLTAKSEVHDQLRGLKIGADDYLSKPFVLDILQTKIANILKQRRRIIRHFQVNITANPVEVTTNTLDEELLEKVRKIILKRMINPDFSVEELSREMSMSRSNLHLKMKAITGESANDFIRRIRLTEACRLLVEGRYNIAEISTVIGFTPSYFSTLFKKHMGCLPTEYTEKKKI